MFTNNFKNSQERLQRLQDDLVEMEKLQRLAPSIFRFVAEGRNDTAPDLYMIEISANSIINVNKRGIPTTSKHFQMEIYLPSSYPFNDFPKCNIYPAPFHPHFKRYTPFLWLSGNRPNFAKYRHKKRILEKNVPRLKGITATRNDPFLYGNENGYWFDPKPNHNEGLGTLMLRIIHSLRFEAKFVDVYASRIGNKQALDWYSYWHNFFGQNLTGWFPTDDTLLPETLPVPQKRFDIEPKKFSVADKIPRDQTGNRSVFTQRKPKKFQILESTPPHVPTVADLPNFRELFASNSHSSYNMHHLYIEPTAALEIFKHISWGKSTLENRVEQGGILLGHVYRDKTAEITFAIVEDAIAGDSAIGTTAHLEMDHATWKKMIDRADSISDSNENKYLKIIGWYHTHPNQLDVFMSGTDKGTQMRFFSNDWQFAIVLNPHRKIWRVFHGENAEECPGYIVVKK